MSLIVRRTVEQVCAIEKLVLPKVRELIAELTAVGFVDRGGRHRNYVRARTRTHVTISGHQGDDAKPYRSEPSGGNPGESAVKDSARYVKIVEWSDEDRCYVGSANAIELYKKDRQPPPRTSGRDLANKLQHVA